MIIIYLIQKPYVQYFILRYRLKGLIKRLGTKDHNLKNRSHKRPNIKKIKAEFSLKKNSKDRILYRLFKFFDFFVIYSGDTNY